MKEINPELVIYRLDKMEAMMAEHNFAHESHMVKIEGLFTGQDERFSGKWVERTTIWILRIIGLALIGAILSLIIVPKATADIIVYIIKLIS